MPILRLWLILAIPFLSGITGIKNRTPAEELAEIIRRKVEISQERGIFSFGVPLHCTRSIRIFYQNRGFQPAWNVSRVANVIQLLESAAQEGLNPGDYHLNLLRDIIGSPPSTPPGKADLDLLVTDVVLLYTSHLFSGKTNPETTDAEWHVTRREGDPVAILEQVAASNNISLVMQAAPDHPAYIALKKALLWYRSLPPENSAPISSGNVIEPGTSDDRIPQIRQRLRYLGETVQMPVSGKNLYDEGLFNAIVQFQKKNGLESDGRIGPRTIGALNIPLADRIGQIRVNMERWRWLPREFGSFYLLVNIANFELHVVRNTRILRKHKVIVGKPFRQTPVFSAPMLYLVFNPTWTVPPGIMKADILPAVRKDVSYLEKKKLQVLDQQGQVLDPAAIDWKNASSARYILRQPPGPQNALGAVKFMFPNHYHVYLHDTPSRELFDQSERTFSSGCIRVQHPLDLAEFLLNAPGRWNKTTISQLIATEKTQTVNLSEKPMVHLIYLTVWNDETDGLSFRRDIYDRDSRLLASLDAAPARIE